MAGMNLYQMRLCMEQLTFKEIMKLITYKEKQAFEDRKDYKINEIRKCLLIN